METRPTLPRIIAVSALCLLLVACATKQQERAATTGAVVGATAGAVIGAQSDRAAEGAVIGGVLGAMAGAVLADDGGNRRVRASAPGRRHGCGRGQPYFDDARRVDDLGEKIRLMRGGIRHCPNNPAAHNDLGLALMLKGNHRAAERHFRKALKIDPRYEPARRNLASLQRERGYGRGDEMRERGKARGRDKQKERRIHRQHRRERYDEPWYEEYEEEWED